MAVVMQATINYSHNSIVVLMESGDDWKETYLKYFHKSAMCFSGCVNAALDRYKALLGKEHEMKELLKNMVYTGVGAAFLTKEKVEELRAELIEKGKMSKEEGKQLVDELLKKSESAKEQLELWLNRRVEEKIKQFNLATVDEVEDLRRQVAELQVALNAKTSDDV